MPSVVTAMPPLPASTRFMYHSFPRRRRDADGGKKGLRILELIIDYGLLLTPEILHWNETKADSAYPDEDYIQVSKRCCFTELAPEELPRHAQVFGEFAIEFDHGALCDLGALPVFYIPRMSDARGYGVGPAIVTQLAHVQELIDRLLKFQQFAVAAEGANPTAQIGVARASDGGYTLFAEHTSIQLHLPKSILDQAKRQNRAFVPPELPEGPAPVGANAQSLLSVFNMLFWGIHAAPVLVGMMKALGNIIHPTERVGDPLLSYYQQREWRLVAGLLKGTRQIDMTLPTKLRNALLDLDDDFFSRELMLPTGKNRLVDECMLYGNTPVGAHVMSVSRRVFCPTPYIAQVQALLSELPHVSVVPI